MSFTVTNLVNDRALVEGQDDAGNTGQQILDAGQFNELAKMDQHQLALDEFNDAVEKHFAKISKAADKMTAALAETEDPLDYIEFEPAVDAVAGTPGRRVYLTKDSKILSLIQDNDTARLRWVNGELEILALA